MGVDGLLVANQGSNQAEEWKSASSRMGVGVFRRM